MTDDDPFLKYTKQSTIPGASPLGDDPFLKYVQKSDTANTPAKGDEKPSLASTAASMVADSALNAVVPGMNTHQAGLLSRYAIEGGTALPTMLANIPAAVANTTRTGADKLLGIPEGGNKVPYVSPFSEGATALGLPEPANAAERLEGDVVRPLVGVGSQAKLGAEALQKGSQLIGPRLAKFFAANPAAQLKSAAAGGAAGGATRELGGGSLAQFLASLTGGFAPSAATGGVRAALRGGSTSQDIKDNVANFKAAGTTPTVGQATQSRSAQALESVLNKIPGGAGVMSNKAKEQAGQISNKVEDIASSLSGKTDETTTGIAIEKGIKKDFIPQARVTQNKLYNYLDKFIPKDKEVGVSNFTKMVDKLDAPIKGAETLSGTKLFVNNAISDVKEALKKDMGGTPAKPSVILGANGKPLVTPAVSGKTTMPYAAIKELRSRIGEKLDQFDLSPDISRTELKRVYGALSEDMKAAAKSAGPKAEAAFYRANKYTAKLHDRMDLLETVLKKNGSYEDVFKAAMSGTDRGATKLNAVMKALPPEEKKMFTSTVLRDMGKAKSGKQNDIGDVFSTETFLTNWNNLDSRAKQVLFGNHTSQFNDDISKIAKVASNLREGSKVFANPSGTAQAMNLVKGFGSVQTGILTAFLSGQPMIAVAAPAGIGLANLAARGMTNPNFVHWLAKQGDKPMSSLPAAVNQLAQIADQKKDEDLKDMAKELGYKEKKSSYIPTELDNLLNFNK